MIIKIKAGSRAVGAQSYQTGGQLSEKALAKEMIELKRTSLTSLTESLY